MTDPGRKPTIAAHNTLSAMPDLEGEIDQCGYNSYRSYKLPQAPPHLNGFHVMSSPYGWGIWYV